MVIDTSTLSPKALANPAVLWASFFGVGFLRPAPGTWGSIAALLCWWFVLADLPVQVQLGIVVLYSLSGWWVSSLVCRRYQLQDAPEIVADEVAGMWLALAFLPALPWVGLAVLLLFRLLDIAKPGPIGWLDRTVKSGLGVMLDDLVAGLAAGGIVFIAIRALGITA